MMKSEKELLLDLKQGSQKAFTCIYHKYCQDVYSLSYKYLGSSQLAEDMLQELFCVIWEKRGEIDPARPFNRYLFTILKHKLLNVLRDARPWYELNEEACDASLVYRPIDEEDELTAEQLGLIGRALDRLSPQKRKVFELKLSGEYSNQEIADKLSVSVNTIKVQYSQSLKEIKHAIGSMTYLWLLLNIPF